MQKATSNGVFSIMRWIGGEAGGGRHQRDQVLISLTRSIPKRLDWLATTFAFCWLVAVLGWAMHCQTQEKSTSSFSPSSSSLSSSFFQTLGPGSFIKAKTRFFRGFCSIEWIWWQPCRCMFEEVVYLDSSTYYLLTAWRLVLLRGPLVAQHSTNWIGNF